MWLKCSNNVLMASKSRNICIKPKCCLLNQHLEMAAKLEQVMICHDLPFYVSSNGHFYKGTQSAFSYLSYVYNIKILNVHITSRQVSKNEAQVILLSQKLSFQATLSSQYNHVLQANTRQYNSVNKLPNVGQSEERRGNGVVRNA